MLKRRSPLEDPQQSIIPVFDEVIIIDEDGNRTGKYYRLNRNYREYKVLLKSLFEIAKSGEEIKWE